MVEVMEACHKYVDGIFGFVLFSDHFSYINYFNPNYGLFYMNFQSFNGFLKLLLIWIKLENVMCTQKRPATVYDMWSSHCPVSGQDWQLTGQTDKWDPTISDSVDKTGLIY